MDLFLNYVGHKAFKIASVNIGDWIFSAMLSLPVLCLNRLIIPNVIIRRILVNSGLL